MKSLTFIKSFAIFVSIIFVAPSVFLVAPQKTYAQFGGASYETNPALTITAPKTAVESTISAIKNTITAVHSATSAVADVALKVNDYVLQPLAFALSGKLMKALTASTVKFVAGISNGIGSSQFVTDYRTSMQSVGDSQALAFFAQFGRNSNSPFAAAISSSLRNNYLQNTSQAGFWAANKSTLSMSSPNANRFLAGDWSQGGAGAWFALTTQDQNNPFTLYQNTLIQSGSLIGSAIGARTLELNWGQGMMSWCGTGETSTLGLTAPESSALNDAQVAADAAQDAFIDAQEALDAMPENPDLNNAVSEAKAEYLNALTKYNALKSSTTGTSPGDPCTNKDGSSGTIRTPGSVIAASLNKALGGTQDKLAQMGQVGKEINGILSDVSAVADVANFASFILGGGASPNSGGILGSGQPSSISSRDRLSQFSDSNYLGVSEADLSKDISSSLLSTEQMAKNISEYKKAWDSISPSVNKASTSVNDLVKYCTAQTEIAKKSKQVTVNGLQVTLGNNSTPIKLVAQTEAAQTALDNDVASALSQVATVNSNIVAANAMIKQIGEDEKNSKMTDAEIEALPMLSRMKENTMPMTPDEYRFDWQKRYTADVQKLQSMSPTAQDITDAQQDAKASADATADPNGSLIVSGDSLIARMNLINKNAKSLKSLCDARFAFTSPSALDDAKSRIVQYELAWNTINDVAKKAETDVVALENRCIAQKEIARKKAESSINYNELVKFISTSDTTAKAARTAFKDIVFPALDQASEAKIIVATANEKFDRITRDLNSTTINTSTYNSLIKELRTMSPTDEDVANAQWEAQDTRGTASEETWGEDTIGAGSKVVPTADSKFSLSISGGTLLGRILVLQYQVRDGVGDPSLSDGIWPWESCDLEGNLSPSIIGGIRG